MSTEELKPCPFCGGMAEPRYNDFYGDMSMVACVSCGATAYISKWNSRHSLKELYKQKYLEALRNIATLEDRLKRYTDQSWELETLRQRVDAQERFDGWK